MRTKNKEKAKTEKLKRMKQCELPSLYIYVLQRALFFYFILFLYRVAKPFHIRTIKICIR